MTETTPEGEQHLDAHALNAYALNAYDEEAPAEHASGDEASDDKSEYHGEHEKKDDADSAE